MPWNLTLDSQYYNNVVVPRSAMQFGAKDTDGPVQGFSREVLDVAEQLTLQLPGIDWTIEVDLLGHHRITIHFEGLSVAVDEPVE